MSKKYLLAYNKDSQKLTCGVYKGDYVYYVDYNDRYHGISEFEDFDDPKEIDKNSVLEWCRSNMWNISREMIDNFIDNFVDYNPGYFTLVSNEKVYQSTVKNKYNVDLDANNPVLKDFVVKNLNNLFKRDRNNEYVLPLIYSLDNYKKDDHKDIEISSLHADKLFKSESDQEGWKYSITLDKNGDVSCYIGSLKQGRPISIESFLNEDIIYSSAEYYCQEDFLVEFNHLVESGVITKK